MPHEPGHSPNNSTGRGIARYLVYGLEKQIDILEEVLERVEAQQELLDLKQNSISLN